MLQHGGTPGSTSMSAGAVETSNAGKCVMAAAVAFMMLSKRGGDGDRA